ncbi:hypothetical protein B0J12DRAFT_230109 [Macrophomina phaseolina]|uniref:DUF6590 domain-containing protein n=1 Tax=Macrophomina phaseolina TaxID=35725 RepID=A0ABQ8GPV0_9PEZI|nr:hypothetical protein B0J12DRAFT_230109 [Macrophomina phaseolina]
MASAQDPTKEWIWHPEVRDYYMQEWDGAQYILVWARAARRDSVAEPVAQESSVTGDLPADTILGNPEQGAYEPLDPSYMIQPNARRFFTTGRMFSVLFTEALGSTAVNRDVDNVSTIMYGEQVFSQIRRFVVVKEGRGFCYACPVSTYGGRGVGKRGLDPQTHAIIYTIGTQPSYVGGEVALEKSPIPIIPAENTAPLTTASRINFAIHHPIQHNVKVKDLGIVHPNVVPTLIQYARSESGW